MNNTTKYIHVFLFIILILGLSGSFGQRNNNRNKNNKFKSGGKFVPGKTNLRKQSSSSNPRARGPTLGDILRASGRRTPPRRRPEHDIDHTNPDEVNRRNYLNNLRNNNRANTNNNEGNSQSSQAGNRPNIGKVVPPLRRAEGEKPPFAPSWTHCVISVQVSIAWVIVKSPNYPNKFQGQVQCSWIATAAEGYRVRLSFKDIDLLAPNGNGCGNQFVEVIDMSLQKSQARFCGSSIPGDYVSEGNKLRLDLQADAISTPYKGFIAAFRADQEIPGRRETSYFAFGQPEVLYNPLTDAPPSNPQFPRTQRPRRPVIAKPRPQTPAIPGQRIYGPGKSSQTNDQKKEEEQDDAQSSPTTHLYIIIAVILVILVAAALAYIFKRYFYEQFKAWRQKQKGVEKESVEINTIEPIYGTKKTLPGNMPLPPTPVYEPKPILRQRQSPSFTGANYPGQILGMYPQAPSYHSSFGDMSRSHSMDDISGKWNEANEEPIYEDDAMSIHSLASSIRSSNRHPDHENFRRQKILQRQNSLMMRRNSLEAVHSQYPSQFTSYPLQNPYIGNSIYEGTYAYNPMEGVYGSLPPTFGPGTQSHYEIHPGFAGKPGPLYTSSMSNLVAGNSGDFLMQQYNGRSASVYDLTSLPQEDMRWPTQLNQRHPSVTSSTSNSFGTNPILKKTKSEPQNELAFSALRAAKSMNDLTAINTKLNECVSWTLPSQRRKSFADLS